MEHVTSSGASSVQEMHDRRDVVCPMTTAPSICKWLKNELTFEDGDVIIQAYSGSGEASKYIHGNTYTDTHTYAHAHARTHTHTHTRLLWPFCAGVKS